MKDSMCWGKTWRRNTPAAITVHRLEHHCLDVLATLDALLARDPGLLTSLAAALGVVEQRALQIVRWCALVHDFGKVARAFQAKSIWGWIKMRGTAARPSHTKCAHDMVGFRAMKRFLSEGADDGDLLVTIIATAFFHHGRPRASNTDYLDPTEFSERLDWPRFEWLAGQADCLVGRPEWPDLAGARRSSWLLTGVVSLVDGLGSAVSDRIMEDASTVPLHWIVDQSIKGVDWVEYLNTVARPVADEVVASIGEMAFVPLRPPSERPALEALAMMAGGIDPNTFNPSPLQAAACVVDLAGQFIAVVEDTTGSGKTEASAMLVRRAIMARISEGGYWGLPTMATANGLYRRFQKISPLLHGGPHSLVLAHGARDDVPLFRATLREVSKDPMQESSDAQETGGSNCLSWLIEGSHRSLLAHCGVGTIDQALFAALNSYHCGIRWVGLHRKVLVVDEVHGADSYMIELLCSTLRHHGELGGSAILMSATLPSATRRKLLDAFAGGTGWSEGSKTLDTKSYPLLTVATSKRTQEIPLETREDRHGASHRLLRTKSEDAAVHKLISWSKAGKCAVWYRNTVKDAIAAYKSLRDAGVPAILFHSRFTRAQRSLVEGEVMDRFGPESDGRLRSGYILVATQVAEQSLDIDFDEAILDLAPADLILQRLGRRRRHRRDLYGNRVDGPDTRPDEPVLLLSPDPDDVQDREWLRSFLPGTSYVYPDAVRMWRSAALLLCPELVPDRKPDLPPGVLIPHLDARPLVEAVYPPDWRLHEMAPVHLKESMENAKSTELTMKAESRARAFNFKQGYLAESEMVSSNFEDSGSMTATRSGDGGVVFLAVERNGKWSWLEKGGMMLSSVPLALNMKSHADGVAASKSVSDSLTAILFKGGLADDTAGRYRRELRLLEDVRQPAVVAMLERSAGCWEGLSILAGSGETVKIQYDAENGLRTEKPG